MKEKGVTTITLKKINREKVYQYIYREKQTSKLQIVQDLQMGLSTVSQNLNALEQDGLICRYGYFESTGGRKAQVIQIVTDVKIAIGIGLLKNMFHIAAVDLYGEAMAMDTIALPYENTAEYYAELAQNIENSSIKMVMTVIGFLVLEHDSKSAAYLELWNHFDLNDAVVFLLNRNLGGAVIMNHHVHQGSFMHSGAIEHMCIDPNGPLCYCGSHGCLETYCSANSLEAAAGMSIKEFFPVLREGKSDNLNAIWQDYLKHLAFAMRNLNMIIDSPIIISGYLAPYLVPEDLNMLLHLINENNPFTLTADQLLVGTHGQYTPAIDAALHYINRFVHEGTAL